MQNYLNRSEAGKILAEQLNSYAHKNDVIVLALPRGGVPVGYEIAKFLNAKLDIFIVRKLGVPGHSELAMGAIAMGNVKVFNEDILKDLNISQCDIDLVVEKESAELRRREKVYRGNFVFPHIKNQIVILVDDGVATGATIRVAIKALRMLEPKKLVVAVPVADKFICAELEGLVDELVCPLCVDSLDAVGAWYVDFEQTEDEEVHMLLREARGFGN